MIEGNKVDLIVTDPPYGRGVTTNHRTATKAPPPIVGDSPGEENEKLISFSMRECYRILKENSSIYVFCDWQVLGRFQRALENAGFNIKNCLIWEKNNWGMGDLKGSYAHKYELILYAHKGRDTLRGKRYHDILRYDRVSNQKLKRLPEKPVDLLEFLILNSSDEGDIVFDPFAGTGSTGEAAILNNRVFFGFEIEKESYEIARRRIDSLS